MLDRRFFDVNLSVLSVANEPANNPTAGSQYIVGSTPTGAFSGATANSIAFFDGSAWSFSKPKITSLEVLNLSTGEILKFNGTAWVVVASLSGTNPYIKPVLDIVASGSALPANAEDGARFLNTTNGKIYTASANDTWNDGTDTSDGDRYASSSDFKIYSNDNGTFSTSNIPNGAVFLNKHNSSLYAYDQAAGAFITSEGQTSDSNSFTETHSLSADEVTAKAFSLTHSVAEGFENKVLLFISGVAQVAGTDFTASGNSISWNGKGLDSIGLVAGDVFIIQYAKA